jgi:NAD-dependent DNA ligase
MLFDDLMKSQLKPFQDFLSVKKAKELDIIPRDYDVYFKEFCSCGSERIVRVANNGTSVTGITCCNLHCYEKIVYQLDELFKRFSVKGIGPAICNKVVRFFIDHDENITFANILLKSGRYNGLSGAEEQAWAAALETINTSRQTMGEFIYKLSYPGIGKKFDDIFNGLSSMDDLACTIQKEGFLHFFSSRGVKSFTTLYYFLEYLPEISQLLEHYKNTILTSTEKVYTVCMTGKMETIAGKYTKRDFIMQCNSLLLSRNLTEPISLKQVDSVSQAMFIVAGSDSVVAKTKKYLAAVKKENEIKSRLNKNDLKILFSPDDFLAFILGGEKIYG